MGTHPTRQLLAIGEKDIKSPDLVQSVLLWTSAGGLIQGDSLRRKSPPIHFLSSTSKQQFVKKKKHSNVNDGLLLHTRELVVILRHGKSRGKTCDSQGKSWPIDLVFLLDVPSFTFLQQ